MVSRRACLALMTALAAPGARAQGLAAVIPKVKPSVVALSRIDVSRAVVPIISGTAFAVGDGTYLVTNAHVVMSETSGKPVAISALVRLGTTLDRRRATVVALMPEADLAVLKLDGPPLPALRLREDPALVAEGTEVGLTGFPIAGALGPIPATHRGIIAAQVPNASPMPDSRGLDPAFLRTNRFLVYQLDTVAYPGNSGSPVFDAATGEVIAIVNSTFIKSTKEKVLSDPSAITYAIPASFAATLLKRAEKAR